MSKKAADQAEGDGRPVEEVLVNGTASLVDLERRMPRADRIKGCSSSRGTTPQGRVVR
jgi:hypothetical protein